MKFGLICSFYVFLLRCGGRGGGGGGREPGRSKRMTIYCPSFLNSSEGSDGTSAAVEMGLAVKEKSEAGLTHVAGGTQ